MKNPFRHSSKKEIVDASIDMINMLLKKKGICCHALVLSNIKTGEHNFIALATHSASAPGHGEMLYKLIASGGCPPSHFEKGGK